MYDCVKNAAIIHLLTLTQNIMKEKLMKLSMLLAFVGLLSTPISFTSCGDDEEEVQGPNDSQKFEVTGCQSNETAKTIEISGKNLTLVQGITLDGEKVEFSVTGNKLVFSYEGMPGGEKDIVISLAGSEPKKYKVNIPGKSLSVPSVTFVQPGEDDAVVFIGSEFKQIKDISIGGRSFVKGTHYIVPTNEMLIFMSLKDFEWPVGDVDVKVSLEGGTSYSVPVTIPDLKKINILITSVGMSTDGQFFIKGKDLDKVISVTIGGTTYENGDAFVANEDGTIAVISKNAPDIDTKSTTLEVRFVNADGKNDKFTFGAIAVEKAQ